MTDSKRLFRRQTLFTWSVFAVVVVFVVVVLAVLAVAVVTAVEVPVLAVVAAAELPAPDEALLSSLSVESFSAAPVAVAVEELVLLSAEEAELAEAEFHRSASDQILVVKIAGPLLPEPF